MSCIKWKRDIKTADFHWLVQTVFKISEKISKELTPAVTSMSKKTDLGPHGMRMEENFPFEPSDCDTYSTHASPAPILFHPLLSFSSYFAGKNVETVAQRDSLAPSSRPRGWLVQEARALSPGPGLSQRPRVTWCPSWGGHSRAQAHLWITGT